MDPFDELRAQIEAVQDAAKNPGRLPGQVAGMRLHSVKLDPLVPGRIRYSYRSDDYEEVGDSGEVEAEGK